VIFKRTNIFKKLNLSYYIIYNKEYVRFIKNKNKKLMTIENEETI
jgi:hypothetical protein